MSRTLSITTSPDSTDELLGRLRPVDGVLSVVRHDGAGVDPPGDVLELQTTNTGARHVLRILRGLPSGAFSSYSESEPLTLVSVQQQAKLEREWSEASWDVVGTELRREADVELNFLVLMLLSGAIAAAGLWQNRVHIVVGAMVLAPGFEPLLRAPFGLIAGSRTAILRGLLATVAGYVVLALGAALTYLVLRELQPSLPADLHTRSWVRYWSSISAASWVIAAVAALGGAVTITAARPIFTIGVMIALALIPSMTIAGMALAAGDLGLATRGVARWGVDAVMVVAVGGLALGVKQALVHRHRTLQ